MPQAAILFGSAIASYFAHHYGERYLTRNWTRNVRLILNGYQIHHSTFGALAIVIAVTIASGFFALALFGYGLGNIWQHKKTHNQFNENGMIFISKIPS